MLNPPDQVSLKDQELDDIRDEIDKGKDDTVNTQTTDWTVSEDYNFDECEHGKPEPRQPVPPAYRGWKEVGGYDHTEKLTVEDEMTDLLSKSSFFDNYLPSMTFGDWYHNVAYMILSGLLSWIFGWFRFSLAPVFFIMLSFGIFYRSSVRKYRQALREVAQREFSVKSIENDYETMDWLNVFLEKFWHFLEPSVAQIVTDQVNPILASSPAPGFIKALWLDSFTAGTKPPRIVKVKTLAGTADDVVVMDWAVAFTPNALADSSNKQQKNNVNEKVVTVAKLFGIEIPVAVSDVSFTCILRVRLRMMTAFPHIETIAATLMEPPHIDFNSRVLGTTSFNWEVLAVPGLYPLINEMIKKYAGPIVFAPLSFQLNVQQLMAGAPLNSAVGLLVIDVQQAKGLRNFGGINNTVDPYVTFGYSKEVLEKTSFKKDTKNPVWNERLYVVVNTFAEPLNINVMDKRKHRSDNQIGSIQYDLETFRDKEKQEITAPIIRNSKPVGELLLKMHYMPTLVSQRQPDGATIPPPELNSGIARVEIAGARHLKSETEEPLTTYAEIWMNGKCVVKTGVQKKTNSPSWSGAKELIIFNRAKTRVKILIKDDKGNTINAVIKRLNDLIDAAQVDDPWFQLPNGGEIQINSFWKPVMLEDAEGTAGYTPPIGVVRVSVRNAEDLRNLETIGKVDPYVRLMINGNERARTTHFDSTLEPSWNEVHYVTVSSPNQKLTMEVMDTEKMGPDRTLGSFDVKLQPLIQKDSKGNYVETVDPTLRTSKLIHKKGPKGTVTYSLSFYPVLPVMTMEDIREEEEEREKDRKIKEKKDRLIKEKGENAADKFMEDETKAQKEEKEEKELLSSGKLRMELDELVEYKSGVFIYEISQIESSKEGLFLQAFFDNHGLHDFVTPKLKQKKTQLTTTGDYVVKELDKSEVTFRLQKKEHTNRVEKAAAEVTVPVLDLMKDSFNKTTTITLEGSVTARVTLQSSWVPVIYASDIPPQDQSDNCGVLSVTALKATDLPAGDSNGKSDPYVKLFLNTERDNFFKSKKIKKTLNPTWNETTEVELTNRYDTVIKVVVFDWDVGPEQDDLLGTGYLKLSEMNSEGETELSVPLFDEDEKDAGMAYFKLSFEPKFILRFTPEGKNFGGALGTGVGAVGHLGKGVGCWKRFRHCRKGSP